MKLNHLTLCVFLLGCANALAGKILPAIAEKGLWVAGSQWFEVSIFVWLSIAITSHMLLEATNRYSTKGELLIALFFVACFIIPSSTINWLFLAGYGLYALSRSTSLTPLYKMSLFFIIMISIREPVVMMGMKVLAEYTLLLDAWFVDVISYLISEPIERVGNILISSSGHGIMVLAGCSSLANISLALLLWLVLRDHTDTRFHPSDAIGIIAVCVAIIALNTLRLSLMVKDLSYYTMFHSTLGTALFEISMVVSVMAISQVKWGRYVR